ncbi:MAG: GFA family protein [Pseudomonadales bacterium]
MSEIETHADGGCLCGAVRYTFDAAPLAIVHCHCLDCQKATGSGFATVFGVLLTHFECTDASAALRDYTVVAASGRTVTRQFCGQCGSPLFTRAALNPDQVWIKAGSLDDPGQLQASASCWADSAQPWAPPPPGVACFAQNP